MEFNDWDTLHQDIHYQMLMIPDNGRVLLLSKPPKVMKTCIKSNFKYYINLICLNIPKVHVSIKFN